VFRRNFSFFAALICSLPAAAKQSVDRPTEPLDLDTRLARAKTIIEELDQPSDYGGVTRDKTDPNKLTWVNWHNWANWSNWSNFHNNWNNFRNSWNNFHNAPPIQQRIPQSQPPIQHSTPQIPVNPPRVLQQQPPQHTTPQILTNPPRALQPQPPQHSTPQIALPPQRTTPQTIAPTQRSGPSVGQPSPSTSTPHISPRGPQPGHLTNPAAEQERAKRAEDELLRRLRSGQQQQPTVDMEARRRAEAEAQQKRAAEAKRAEDALLKNLQTQRERQRATVDEAKRKTDAEAKQKTETQTTQPTASSTTPAYTFKDTSSGTVQVYRNGKLVGTGTPQYAQQYGYKQPNTASTTPQPNVAPAAPITSGYATTPSGAVVDVRTGKLISPPPPPQTASAAQGQSTRSAYTFMPTSFGTVQISKDGKIIATTTPQLAAQQYGYQPGSGSPAAANQSKQDPSLWGKIETAAKAGHQNLATNTTTTATKIASVNNGDKRIAEISNSKNDGDVRKIQASVSAGVKNANEDAAVKAILSGQKIAPPSNGATPSIVSLGSKPINLATAREVQPYSVLSADAYADRTKPGASLLGFTRMSDDWKTTMTKSGLPASKISDFSNSDFYAATYINNQKKEIVISFRGSLPPAPNAASVKDWATNIGARFLPADGQIRPIQYEAALTYANTVRQMAQRNYPGYKITLTGHSEGGGEASYAGNRLGLDTYTFNSARNAFSTEQGSGSSSRQVNVYTIGDFVGDPDVSKLAGKGLLPGVNVFVGPTGGLDLPLGQRHSIENVEAGIGEYLLRAQSNRP